MQDLDVSQIGERLVVCRQLAVPCAVQLMHRACFQRDGIEGVLIMVHFRRLGLFPQIVPLCKKLTGGIVVLGDKHAAVIVVNAFVEVQSALTRRAANRLAAVLLLIEQTVRVRNKIDGRLGLEGRKILTDDRVGIEIEKRPLYQLAEVRFENPADLNGAVAAVNCDRHDARRVFLRDLGRVQIRACFFIRHNLDFDIGHMPARRRKRNPQHI